MGQVIYFLSLIKYYCIFTHSKFTHSPFKHSIIITFKHWQPTYIYWSAFSLGSVIWSYWLRWLCWWVLWLLWCWCALRILPNCVWCALWRGLLCLFWASSFCTKRLLFGGLSFILFGYKLRKILNRLFGYIPKMYRPRLTVWKYRDTALCFLNCWTGAS